MDIQHQKLQLRQSIEGRLKSIPAKDRETESRSLCRRVLEALRPEWKTIAAFVPLRTEPDIVPLLQEFLKRGIALHLTTFGQKKLCFRKVEDLLKLATGALGIPEPDRDATFLDPATLDLAIIPARAFDRKGWRLGRGNGGYDMWIREQRKLNVKTQFWGVALECQIVNTVPREEHDEKVDAVITARGFVSPPPRGEG